MKLTKENIKQMLPGQILAVKCINAAELDSVYQTALKARKEMNTGKESVRITRLAKEMKVEVEIFEEGGAK